MRVAFFHPVFWAALVGATFASRAGAQSAADKAAAEGLFDQGRASMQEGDFAKACGLLERSQHIDPGVGTLLYLAECYEKSGRTASAWATFREASDAADAAREPVRARTGRDRAARLEPILSRLTIHVAPEVQQIAGLTIERSGRPLQPAVWNVPVPVDPSDYEVKASAPGYEPWSQVVSVAQRAAKVAVTVPPLKKAPEAIAPAPTDELKPSASPSGEPPLPAPPSPSQGRVGSGQRTAAFVVGAAGIVGIGIGTVFGLRAISKNNDAKANCPRGYECDSADGPEFADAAKSAARVSNIAFGAGAAALIGGAVLYFTSPRSPEGTSVRATMGPRGITVWGSFQ
jgi:hypothetical protein